jgi:hypothetical protein
VCACMHVWSCVSTHVSLRAASRLSRLWERLCVCVYVCMVMHQYARMCLCAYMYTEIYGNASVCMYVSLRAASRLSRVRERLCVCVCVCMHV